MATAAHTSGQWKSASRGMNLEPCVVATRAGRPVTVAHVLPRDVKMAEAKANAHLISAAPELLELAKLLDRSLVYEIKKSESAGDDEGARLKSVTLGQVRAAISKAEGR